MKQDQCNCEECQSYTHQLTEQEIHEEEMKFLELIGVEVKQVDNFADALAFVLND